MKRTLITVAVWTLGTAPSFVLPVLAVIPGKRTATQQKRAVRRRVCLALGFGTTVAASLAIVAYTFIP
jgi:hypothetical protein